MLAEWLFSTDMLAAKNFVAGVLVVRPNLKPSLKGAVDPACFTACLRPCGLLETQEHGTPRVSEPKSGHVARHAGCARNLTSSSSDIYTLVVPGDMSESAALVRPDFDSRGPEARTSPPNSPLRRLRRLAAC